MVYEVRRLRLLRELAAHGTIAAAAQACHLTPSAVSQQLGLLEREVGTPLLLRDGRRVVLTEAARVLVAHTERVLAELEEARAQVAGLTGEVRGTVRLGAFPSAAVALAAPAIAACRAEHPDLRIVLDETEPDESVDALRHHACDVALVYEYNLLPGSATRAWSCGPSSASPSWRRCHRPRARRRWRSSATAPGSRRAATRHCAPCWSAPARRPDSSRGSTTPATTTR